MRAACFHPRESFDYTCVWCRAGGFAVIPSGENERAWFLYPSNLHRDLALRSIYFAATAALLLGAAGCATLSGGSQSAVLRAKDRVAPALVHIRPVKEVFSLGKREEVALIGSGFIISPDGYVVTNEHVAGETEFVKCVLSDKSEVEAVVVGADPFTDIAVLKLKSGGPFPNVRFGDSDRLESGQTVLALGSPHGLARSVSMGIVSVTDRYLDDNGRQAPFNTFIQTDAAINRGNSGGPLVDLRGEVIGVNARMLSGAENVGFAIPVSIVREVVEKIIATGRVQRSWVGVNLQEMRAKTDDPAQAGVVIADVDPLSPAYEAKVQPGDILVAVNGAALNARFEEDLPAVRRLIADLPVGQPAAFSVQRGEERLEIAVTTEEHSAFKGEEVEFVEWGFTAAALTPEIVRRAQLPSRNGVLVSGVQVGGMAGAAGLQQGDIILELDGVEIPDLAAFRKAYRQVADSGKPLTLLLVKRGAMTRYVLVKQGEQPAPATMEGNDSHAE